MEEKKHGSKSKLIIILAIIVVLIIGACVGGMLIYRNKMQQESYSRYEFDTDAMEGRISRMTEEEVQAELNRVVDEGMFRICIDATLVVDPTTKLATANIENAAENRYYMQVDITLDDNGEKVYSSKLIRPGYSISQIKLNTTLAPGKYEATATFNAITQEEMELLGSAAAKITIIATDKDGRYPVDQ